jgi:hypothetical protein
MANNPISPIVITETSGMNGGASDSVIGIATDVINPSLSSFPRVEVGARSSPIGLESPALGAAAYYVDYENASFDRSPVIFAEADNDAAVGEVFATTLNFSVTNESSDSIKTGEWLWGVAVPGEPSYYSTGPTVDLNDWIPASQGSTAQDTPEYIRVTPVPLGGDSAARDFYNPNTFLPDATPLVVGATYRIEITVGDSTLTGTSASIGVLVKTGNLGAGLGTLTSYSLIPNTLGADQPFEFVANRTGVQIQVRAFTIEGGYVQLGELSIYGPIST